VKSQEVCSGRWISGRFAVQRHDEKRALSDTDLATGVFVFDKKFAPSGPSSYDIATDIEKTARESG